MRQRLLVRMILLGAFGVACARIGKIRLQLRGK